jgi:hypothetical protein
MDNVFKRDVAIAQDLAAMSKNLNDPDRVISVATIDGVTISTIRLPDKMMSFPNKKHRWETCIFYTDGNSKVVKTYDSPDAAKLGHDMFVIRQVTKARE